MFWAFLSLNEKKNRLKAPYIFTRDQQLPEARNTLDTKN